MAKKQFKAESKRLLDLMINSIYTNKEIFLRELISNASDAEDKLYYKTLSEGISGLSRNDFAIHLSADKESRTLTISDNGIGMSKDELDKNLGTIAKSGSRLFRNESEGDKNAEDIDIIGQFGVGFYSAFMVASSVEVISKAFGAEEAWAWKSTGADGYTITEAEREGHGTDIILTLKEDTEEENYSAYLDEHSLAGLVKKYSDYIRYPIRMNMTTSEPVDGETEEDGSPKYQDVTKEETLNTMAPIWKKNKNEVTEEEYNQFYMQNFMDWNPPMKVIHSSTEGAATYNALLFIPGKAPMDLYSKDYEKGLKLYASGVLIMDCCKDLLGDYFGFVKGLVDSEDLSLNISREMLQQDRQVQIIARSLEKKIKSELLKMLRQDREQYETFFKEFGANLKYGTYSDYGQHAELLRDLLLFHSSFTGGYTTLEEYVGRMKEDQKYIYYAAGDSLEQIASLPQVEMVADKGYEILYFTESIDEFAIKMMWGGYEGKEFRSVSDDDLGFDTQDEKDSAKAKEEENKEFFDFLKESLGGKATAVKVSSRLKSAPACISTEGGISLEMEKMLSMQMNAADRMKAQKVLELNTEHPIFAKMKELYETDKEKAADYVNLLFDQALLLEGITPENPSEFTARILALM